MNFWAISSFTPIIWCVCAARYLGIKSPIPYTWKDYAGKERLLYGMNYAYGGTGVFKTKDNPLPNMTTQIDYFQRVLAAGNIYTPSDLPSSLALVSVAGNDYATFMALKRPVTVSKHHFFVCSTFFKWKYLHLYNKTICQYLNFLFLIIVRTLIYVNTICIHNLSFVFAVKNFKICLITKH